MAYVQLVARVQAPLKNLSQYVNALIQGHIAFERVSALESLPSDLYDNEEKNKDSNEQSVIKQQIIEVLSLEEITPESIVDSEPLFGDGLGLDSIDALELIVLLDRTYGIRLSSPAEGKQVFASIDTMADYIQQHRTK